jgi:hypothetical protein
MLSSFLIASARSRNLFTAFKSLIVFSPSIVDGNLWKIDSESNRKFVEIQSRSSATLVEQSGTSAYHMSNIYTAPSRNLLIRGLMNASLQSRMLFQENIVYQAEASCHEYGMIQFPRRIQEHRLQIFRLEIWQFFQNLLRTQAGSIKVQNVDDTSAHTANACGPAIHFSGIIVMRENTGVMFNPDSIKTHE